MFAISAIAQEAYVPVAGDKIVPVDYAQKANWMFMPTGKEIKGKVDVFYIYPTVWEAGESGYPLADINDAKMREAAKYQFKTQGSAFEVGNVFAPYYRQLELNFALSKGGIAGSASKYYGGMPKSDIIAAFDYYIKHYNNGRPFILAGHSQGSMMIRELLIGYMKDHPDVYSRMVAAYVIGFPMTKNDYAANTYLKPAQSADDTGVIISYNTQAPDVEGINILVVPNSVMINPLTWTTTEEEAGVENNLGSMIVVNGKLIRLAHLADARISYKDNALICSSVDKATYSSAYSSFFPAGVYHENDIPFYYFNLRQNAKNRIDKFLNNK
jgi:hypothetical protein